MTSPDDPNDIDRNNPVFRFLEGVSEVLMRSEEMEPTRLKRDLAEVIARHPEPPRALGLTAREQAQQMMDEAWGMPGEGTAMALDALRLDDNCADAWVYLGYDAGEELELALVFFTLGLMAGFETLGQEMFEQEAGNFWLIDETRPFMRALEAVARTNWDLGAADAAASYFAEMIRLNPMDNQGARHGLLWLSLERGDTETAEQVFLAYPEDESTAFTFGKALLAFMQEGDTPAARVARGDAVASNPHLPALLARTRTPEPDLELEPMFEVGTESEAVAMAPMMMDAFDRVPGAGAWIAEGGSEPIAAPPPPPAPSKEKRSGPRAI
ncbi:MAG: hypothetical protein U0547_04400 [Dehalococcoidia bacterium]